MENPIYDIAAVPDAADDGCSICLELFTAQDPATVTNCKHEYHLQCILDWSQRSKECPICWQLLALKDPDSQELLATMEVERNARSAWRSSNASTYPRIPPEDFEFHNVPVLMDESDLDERIMQHLAAAALARGDHLRRERHRSSGYAHSQFLVFGVPSNGSDVEQDWATQGTDSSVSPQDSIRDAPLSPATAGQPRVSVPVAAARMSSEVSERRLSAPTPRIMASQTLPSSPRRSRSSEILSFSESLKSKLSAASSRYKESISKSTRGFKEKLLARNNSVKELSKEVHREVTAGIAGVARMMERLDPSSKREGGFSSVSSSTEGTSESFPSGNVVQENMTSHSHNKSELAASSTIPVRASCPVSGSLVGVANDSH